MKNSIDSNSIKKIWDLVSGKERAFENETFEMLNGDIYILKDCGDVQYFNFKSGLIETKHDYRIIKIKKGACIQ